MGLSTHVLDTQHGAPAAGMAVKLFKIVDGVSQLERDIVLNSDGRNPEGPLYNNTSLRKGMYRLVFDVAGYFRRKGVDLPDPPFLDQVAIDFGIADEAANYHVPLLVTAWSYSTYRGS
jgi:5-hydroxyisourate hydrolase